MSDTNCLSRITALGSDENSKKESEQIDSAERHRLLLWRHLGAQIDRNTINGEDK